MRGLVKLKRHAEAVRAAEALAKTNRGNRLLVLLAYAAAGDAAGAMAVMERVPRQPYLVYSVYADPDLGPLLRGEPMRPSASAIRSRHPTHGNGMARRTTEHPPRFVWIFRAANVSERGEPDPLADAPARLGLSKVT